MSKRGSRKSDKPESMAGGWWFAHVGKSSDDGYILPFAAGSKAAANVLAGNKMAQTCENMQWVLCGPFGSKWEAWHEIHKSLTTGEKPEG